MALKLFICLSLATLTLADDVALDDATKKVVDACLAENNVSEEDVHMFGRQEIEATPEIKDFFLCVTQKLGTFDGSNWNREAIKKVINDDEKMKDVDECLAKDDASLEARERNMVVITCCIEKEAFM